MIYYNTLKTPYGEKWELIYTNMDNLLPEIQTDDVYGDVEDSKHLYDTGGFPKDHPLHSATNKEVLGKMKDEMNGTPTAECVEKHEKVCCEKRDKACALQRNAFLPKNHKLNMLHIEGHEIYGVRVNKISLSPFDSKRYIAENQIDTLAYGHRLTEELDTYISELVEVILSKEAQSLAWAHFVNSREQALWECWSIL